ncbi:MAG: hypothetical protein LC798_17060 [Chloroflexi bacterium]|nr:hypothetical protein [Chloroflexota bacterium]
MGEWADYWYEDDYNDSPDYIDNRVTLNGAIVTVDEVEALVDQEDDRRG